MEPLAISTRRISSIGQIKGHSLEAQAASTIKMADELKAEIVKTWDIVQTSNRGKNFKRKDMEEALRFCKQNKRVKYFLFDFVGRVMREAEVLIYYKVLFNQLGVQLVFCDPSQRYLNGNDQYTRLMLMIEAVKAEMDNDSRRETVIARMKSRYSQGYYISKPHAGYIKSSIPGLHIPDPERFKLLQECGKRVIYKQYSVPQAIKWLNAQGYRTPGGKIMDVDHYSDLMIDRYYCGIIDINKDDWPKGVKGVHQQMFSPREHQLLVERIKKRNIRVLRKNNPDFPMANILRHYECRNLGKYEKFSGHWFNRGKRKSGRQRPLIAVYDCRDCRKRIRREYVHKAFSEYLAQLNLVVDEAKFKNALIRVWKNQQGVISDQKVALRNKKTSLEQKIKQTASAMVSESVESAKSAMRALIDDYDKEVLEINNELSRLDSNDLASADFVNFALNFIKNLQSNWWSISADERKRGEMIIFKDKIYIDNLAEVHTPDLSPIYRLESIKKDLSFYDKSLLVELPVIATGSDC